MALLVTSLPLSLTIIFGLPYSAIGAVSSRAMRAPEIEVSAISAQVPAGAVVDDGQHSETAAVIDANRQLKPIKDKADNLEKRTLAG